ncbi:hypothetical protein GCM10010424_74610 [Streptomyces lienomycini]
MSLTGGNRNDVTRLEPLLDKVPAVAGRVGAPRRRPDALLADRGYDHDKYRRLRSTGPGAGWSSTTRARLWHG